jgi:alpha-tubulin suppressor-like RCC1 family protein
MTKIALALALPMLGCLLEPGRPQPPTDDTSSRLTLGDVHACWIDPMGQGWCWGHGSYFELGDGGQHPQSSVPISIGSGWTYLSAHAQFTCGIQQGQLMCWGVDSGTVADMFPTPIDLPIVPVRVEVGYSGNCVYDENGVAYCWGDMFGSATPTQLTIPGSAPPWATIQPRFDHACAIDGAGKLRCWGKNDQLQLGMTSTMSPVPIENALTLDGTFIALAHDYYSSCAIDSDHHLVCWGNGEFDNAEMTAKVVDMGHHWTHIAMEQQHACGIVDGVVYCMGQDDNGALGDGFRQHTDPRRVATSTPESAIGTGAEFTCAASDGGVSCWGANQFGQLGNGELAVTLVPALVDMQPSAPLPQSIIAGRDHSCALWNGMPYCWGRNLEHQSVPQAPITDEAFSVPTMVGGVQPSTSLVAGSYHTCTQTQCWGTGDALGGSGPIATVPMSVGPISAGDETTCVADSGNKTRCFGTLPWMNNTSTSTPTQISPTTTPTTVASGGSLVAVIDDTMSVDYAGQLCGVNATTLTKLAYNFASSPPALVAVSAYPFYFVPPTGHICVARTDGSEIDCFGVNDQHQVSSSTAACLASGSATTDPEGAKWLATIGSLSIANRHSCAINTNSHLYCWGQNTYGELGTLGYVSATPTAVDPTKTWREVSTGFHHSCGITFAGEVYCWGINKYGELGSGTRYHEKPVDVVF